MTALEKYLQALKKPFKMFWNNIDSLSSFSINCPPVVFGCTVNTSNTSLMRKKLAFMSLSLSVTERLIGT